MQHGGEHIDVSISDGAWATISVTDDAPGPVTCGGSLHIAPFGKANPTFAAPHLGLGLPTSLRLAQLMGGDLAHQHTPGDSTFTLTLPLCLPRCAPTTGCSSSEAPDTSVPPLLLPRSSPTPIPSLRG